MISTRYLEMFRHILIDTAGMEGYDKINMVAKCQRVVAYGFRSR